MQTWETADLLEVQHNLPVHPDGFWISMFTREHHSEAEKIYMDDLPLEDRRLAPFVAPNVQGRVMADQGHSVSSFKPAYIKVKSVIDPTKAIPRMPGEPILGNLSLEQRFDAHVAAAIRRHDEAIDRRIDWMAAQAVINGSVLITGEDYPSVTVDFKRDASLVTALGAGARWNEETANPMADISLQRKNAFTRGRAPVSKMVFGLDAWDAFSSRADIRELLDKTKGGSNSEFNRTGLQSGEPYEYQGKIGGPNGGGQIELWTYSNTYVDPEDGATKDFLNPKWVVGVGANIQGVRAYGAIMDKKAGLKAMPKFPKMWESEDPSATFVMTQSAPLPVLGNANDTFLLKVLV